MISNRLTEMLNVFYFYLKDASVDILLETRGARGLFYTRCCKYLLAHQMWINPSLKIAPNKCTIYCSQLLRTFLIFFMK